MNTLKVAAKDRKNKPGPLITLLSDCIGAHPPSLEGIPVM